MILKDELLASTDLAQFGIRKIKRFIVIQVVQPQTFILLRFLS
ncbi:hypothetical protein VITU9109_03867 [Vibrio tubiashii ATCC 19109]|uniref:Uncharacterized protein n=1 Tax=Vibrio tubiashii ATCC 19109 TaxID=1051646 RepID=A0ABP2LIJ5_9VIBR|nr:hypothetical protein VITU9109_03867 [Vibrio tubiashii ATCC 19109]